MKMAHLSALFNDYLDDNHFYNNSHFIVIVCEKHFGVTSRAMMYQGKST